LIQALQMSTRKPPIALVTGACRGVGRGVAVGLVKAGFRVYATGRSIALADLPEEVRRLSCDHLRDEETDKVFQTIEADGGGLDLLANCAWGGYERMVENGVFTWPAPFWEQPIHRWTSMMDVGVRAAYVCSARAARLMVPRRHGLIVNISFWATQKRLGNVLYGISKAATDKLTSDAAEELAPFGVTAISIYPGLVRTEAVLAAAASGAFDLSNSESPEFIGRVIAGLYSDSGLMKRTGQALVSKYHIQTQNRQVLTWLSIYGYFGARGRVHRQPQGMSSRNSAIRTVNRIRSQKPGQRNDISARGLRCS
jgi:NAD(P)-dependent dehydrogenase (short-subunit alcohol dehydrogenase family)